ncbi:hypothetical protein C4D60_Mb08t13330 [Musa balbisiana]|uniref:BHLH domain-containing protein n=1 Tax=Musa balbisiana TaxID=52838 RepID=A0A4S8K3I4_MUSBA|nr:hypothetical protein C4D60_Mb08t13330 [Musa balbisiana]
MAQQGLELSTVPNDRWEIHPNPFSWTAITQCCSNAAAAASFADASSHSALSMDSSSGDASGEPAENRHMWSHVLLDVEDAGEVDDGENFLEVLSSRRLTADVFEPACANSKKMDSCRELHPSSLHSLGSIMQPDFANNWSLAPSNPQLEHHLAPSTCNGYISASMLIDHLASDTSHIRGNSRDTGTVEGKKKRSDEESTETLLKKSKYDSSMVSPTKLQVPKARMAAERISALQQIVSPFGKTDQASVLMETIFCIKSLQEQIQLLSDPYMKSSASEDHNSWGQLERKVKAQAKVDLRSKGLCLVPISSISQVHTDNSRPDYWMPTYRSCFYKLEPPCVDL